MSSKSLILACGLTGLVALLGGWFMDRPYRLEGVGHPGDQAVLDHRDSPYSSITLVASPADNYLQLRFFDRVEGGVCLKPTWTELADLAKQNPTLAHLVPATTPAAKPAGPMWPHSWTPNPGTLSNSAYVRMFPVGVLMNERLMAAAKGDQQTVAPRIMVVGLGSGIGIATLAYHFPQASITVVDIDRVVIALVRDHYPLLDWLANQKRADGEPRLRFVARDARQFIRFDAVREAKPYDLVILDAYTSGSTIPPHLMTREFFGQCSSILGDGGLVLANIIGNVASGADGHGDKSLVLGGAIRSFRAAGLEQAWCFPILNPGDSAGFVDANRQRNNIVIAGKAPLDPHGAAAGWERIGHFIPVPELPIGTYVTSSYLLVDSRQSVFTSASLDAALVDRADPTLRTQMNSRPLQPDAVQQPLVAMNSDRHAVERTVRAVRALADQEHIALPEGWRETGTSDAIQRRDTDWVMAARETVRTSVATARDAAKWSGVALTGDVEQGERPPVKEPTWLIPEAPLFTDQRPNADIYNH